MKNQKLILHLKVYNSYGNSGQVAYDRSGKVLNGNQIIKLQHDSLEWTNFLKNLKYLGYIKIELSKIMNESINDEGVKEYAENKTSKVKFQHQIDTSLFGEEIADKMRKENQAAKPKT